MDKHNHDHDHDHGHSAHKPALRAKDEFTEEQSTAPDLNKMSGMTRRNFLGIMAASSALATTSCTRYKDKGQIVNYTKRPEHVSLGKASYYASTCTGCEQACGILIKTREGRPIKVDGNPEHPANMGALCSRGQSSVMNLYSPDRLKAPLQTGKATTWETVDKDIPAKLKACADGGKEIAIVCHSVVSPTTAALLEDFKKAYPTTTITAYELFNSSQREQAWSHVYGAAPMPVISIEKAKILVSFEHDFLGAAGNEVEMTRQWAMNRNPDNAETYSRLYAFEGNYSVTGMNADYRSRVRPDAQFALAMALLNEAAKANPGTASQIADAAKGYELKAVATEWGIPEANLTQLAKDLLANRGKAMVFAGEALPVATHVAVLLLNDLLGNTALYSSNQAEERNANVKLANFTELNALMDRMKSGKVGATVHIGSNPVFHFPAYAEALKGVTTSITLVEQENETSAASTYTLPVHHNFEAWGDAKTRSGVYSLQQPVIQPIFNSRQAEGLLLQWSKATAYDEMGYHAYLKNRWQTVVYPAAKVATDFDTFWFAVLHDGVVTVGSEQQALSRTALPTAAAQLAQAKPNAADFLLILGESKSIGDGRDANNGWQQELPHSITKVTWDNYLAISVTTAKNLGVNTGDFVTVTTPTGALDLPAYIQPGMADNVGALDLGYGRTNAGAVGSGIGFNANTFVNPGSSASPWLINGVTFAKGRGSYKLARTQGQQTIDAALEIALTGSATMGAKLAQDIHLKREIIREGSLSEYRNNPHFLHKHGEHPASYWRGFKEEGIKWGMAIDLNRCTGCNACTAACNVENNVPVVGKEQVAKGREMHWIRIDRYFAGEVDNPEPGVQPMLCQHCDNAPCENVCPVAATAHSPEGLNDMAYNRCVGTRYCSNNCPYKVRRFNYFDFRNAVSEGHYNKPENKLLHNPEVTVRSRGVMEKCTFCVQRIMEARAEAKRTGKPLTGSEVTTACQQACSSRAISFGNLNDKNSEVRKQHEHALAYRVLPEVNAAPSIAYLTKLKNTENGRQS